MEQANQAVQSAPAQAVPKARPVKKKKKGWIAAVIIIVILAGIGGGIVACSKALSTSLEQMSAGMLETAKVEKRDIEDSISVSGKVESVDMVKITSTVTGKVSKVYVEVGSEVKEGDILCEFDSSDLQRQYDMLSKTISNADGMSQNMHRTYERNLRNAQNERTIALDQAQRAIDKAKKAREDAHKKEKDLVEDYNKAVEERDDAAERAELLINSDPERAGKLTATAQEKEALASSLDAQIQALRDQFETFDSAVQSAQDAYDQTDRTATSQIQSIQDQLDNEQYNDNTGSSRSDLEKLQDSIDKCTVRAPRDGIITSLNITEGSIPNTDALMTIEDTNALKITVSVAEQDILRIHKGMEAIVKTNATGDEEFKATVSRVVNIYKAGNTSAMPMMGGGGGGDSGGYSAEISIDDKENKLLIGMTAKVRIMLQQKDNVLAVPYESIISEDEDEENAEKYVLLAITDDKGLTRAKKCVVETGMEGSFYTEITGGDLKEGDTIVVTPGDYKDGDVLPIYDFSAALNQQNDLKSNEGGKNE